MKKSYALLIITVILLSGCSLFTKTYEAEPLQPTPISTESNLPISENSQEKLETEPTGNAVYTEYTTDLHEELDGNKPYAIFFHAVWCPQCKILESQLLANLKDLPDSVTILQADYDKETELKARYDVRIQSTVVFIGKDREVFETVPYTSNFFQVADALIRNATN